MFLSIVLQCVIATIIYLHPDEVSSASTGRAVTDFCASQPCENGARCLHDSNGFICQCKVGFTGKFCETGIFTTPLTTPSGNTCVDSQFIKCNDSHVCVDPGLAKYCPLSCKLCKPCKDSLYVNCIKAVCADPGLKKYCPVTCNACDTSFYNNCIYKGKRYKTGEQWIDNCDYNCTCKDGSTGLYTCTSLCFSWNLPSVCTLDPPKAGKCCKIPNCPAYVHISYPPGYIAH